MQTPSITRSIIYPGYQQILPNNTNYRPRTLVYVSRAFKPIISIDLLSPDDPDLIVINIQEGNSKLQLLNIYNQLDQGDSGKKTLERHIYSLAIYTHSIILGDFNIHHP